jgi:phosphodiesterase/alkaline phosphatase D-like protein
MGVLAASGRAASSPAVVTGGTSGVGHTSAVLRGTVNPSGSATTYSFQWGLTTAYGFSSASRSAGSHSTRVAAAATASDLTPGTVYHYRLVASNAFGTTVGLDRTFETTGTPPPGITTETAVLISSTTATLTGSVLTNGAVTSWMFQYGPSPALGAQTYAQTLSPTAAAQPVAAGVAGLTPGTIFYYRLVGLHGTSVITYGSIAFFMTFPVDRPAPAVRAVTAPHHSRSRPFVFTTSGTVLLPPGIPSWAGCGGTATIRYFLGPRRVASTVAAIQPSCSFTGQVAFARKPGRGPSNRIVRLNVFIHFNGNGYLAPEHARVEHVILG